MKSFLLLLALVQILSVQCGKVKKVSLQERNPSFWLDKGRDQLMRKLNEKSINFKAKNIILAIGDGMGISTVTSARIVKNQRQTHSKLPDENLIFENFPNVGLSQTYCSDRYVCDSTATATAILTGTKINSGVVGMSSEVLFENCNSYNEKYKLINIAEIFHNQGKSVGFVTTASIVDATPAAIYASSPSRTWKHLVKKNCSVKDIASQFLEKSERFNVVLGGGRKYFMPKNYKDQEYPYKFGLREDGRHLIEEWNRKMTDTRKQKAKFIWNSTELHNINTKSTDYLLGLFEYGDMNFSDENLDNPTLAEMTKKALEILQKNSNGYFLLIEGALIDKAHHKSQAIRAILETLELEKAVSVAVNMSNSKDTLIIVTADHSHTLTLGSYVFRETDIMGINKGFSYKAMDNKGHTSLLYSNGPGYKIPRENITSQTKFRASTVFNSGVPLFYETHAGEDVTVYSIGPWSHLLTGLYEQSYIGTVMMFASCSDKYEKREGCNRGNYLRITQLMMAIVFIHLFIFT